ncbi:hypothetical protein GGS24DRAFT_438488, partial [Hypoxylon argillaceum]
MLLFFFFLFVYSSTSSCSLMLLPSRISRESKWLWLWQKRFQPLMQDASQDMSSFIVGRCDSIVIEAEGGGASL